MSLPSTSARASTTTDFAFTPTPSRSESVGPSFGVQDRRTQSPFGLPFDYGHNFSGSRGGTPFDTPSDGSGSMGHGPGMPMGGSTTQWPSHMAMGSHVSARPGRSGGVFRHGPDTPAPRYESRSSNISDANSQGHPVPSANLIALQTEVNVLRQALSGIISALPEVVAVSNVTLPGDFVVPAIGAHANRAPAPETAYGPVRTREPLPPVLRTDVPLITIWTTQDWAEITKDDDATDPNQVQKKKGKTNAHLGFNMTMRFVQYKNGNMISGYYATEIREAAYHIWYELLLRGLAPFKWSHLSLIAADFYYQEMAHRFPELRFCGGSPVHWKAKQIATVNYPAFVQGLSRKDMAHLLKPAPCAPPKHNIRTGGEPEPDHETDSDMVLISDLSPSSRMKRQAQTHHTALPARHTAAKRQRRAHGVPTATTSTLSANLPDPLADVFLAPSTSSHATHTQQGPVVPMVDNRVGTEPTGESVPAHAALNVGEAPNTRADVARLTNSHIKATNAIHHTDGDAAADAITSRDILASDPANVLAAAPSTEGGLLAATRSTEDEGGRRTVATSNESGPSAAEVSTEGTGPAAAPSMDGGSVGILNKNAGIKLWLLRTVTARSICGHEWKLKTGDGTKEAFDIYWKTLSKPEKKIYNDQAKEMKAARTGGR